MGARQPVPLTPQPLCHLVDDIRYDAASDVQCGPLVLRMWLLLVVATTLRFLGPGTAGTTWVLQLRVSSSVTESPVHERNELNGPKVTSLGTAP